MSNKESYKNKYLKYKNKYLNLINQSGGNLYAHLSKYGMTDIMGGASDTAGDTAGDTASVDVDVGAVNQKFSILSLNCLTEFDFL